MLQIFVRNVKMLCGHFNYILNGFLGWKEWFFLSYDFLFDKLNEKNFFEMNEGGKNESTIS